MLVGCSESQANRTISVNAEPARANRRISLQFGSGCVRRDARRRDWTTSAARERAIGVWYPARPCRTVAGWLTSHSPATTGVGLRRTRDGRECRFDLAPSRSSDVAPLVGCMVTESGGGVGASYQGSIWPVSSNRRAASTQSLPNAIAASASPCVTVTDVGVGY